MQRGFFFFVMCCVAAPGVAMGEGTDVKSAQASLDYTLTTLRGSVEKLTQENQTIAATNEKLRAQLPSFQIELSNLQRDEAKLAEQFSALEGKYQKRTAGLRGVKEQVIRGQAESLFLDKEMAEVLKAIEAKEKVDADFRTAVEKKAEEIVILKTPTSGVEEDAARLVQEKNRLQAEIEAKTVSLQQARDEWLELQGIIQGGTGRVAVLRKERDNFVRTIEAKKNSCARISEKLAKGQEGRDGVKALGNPENIAALEGELRKLDEEYRSVTRELSGLKKGESEKTKKGIDPIENERRKLEGQIAAATDRNSSLKLEVNRLRRQMVDLDKKKIQMERVIYGSE